MQSNPSPQDTPPAPPRAQLLITFHADGSIQVQGAVHDKVLAYGLLECARDAIKDAADRAARQSAIQVARPADPMLINPRRNGNHNGG